MVTGDVGIHPLLEPLLSELKSSKGIATSRIVSFPHVVIGFPITVKILPIVKQNSQFDVKKNS
jgi:hypothetical protein